MYVRFHFASNGVNICVRAWQERSVTDLHAKPRQFKPLTGGLDPVGLRGERLMNARSTPSRKYSRRSKRSEINSSLAGRAGRVYYRADPASPPNNMGPGRVRSSAAHGQCKVNL